MRITIYITGYPDRPPLRISFPQAWLLGSSQAAMATMIAHHEREINGEGQFVDVSVQASITWTITNAIPLWELTRANLSRQGSVIKGRYKGIQQRTLYRCKDGFVAYTVVGGQMGISVGNPPLAKWINEEGMGDDFLRNFDWASYGMAKATQEDQDKLEGYVERFVREHTKLELYEGGLKRGILIYPVYSPKDVMKDPQLKARDFWVQVEHPEFGASFTYPGAYFKSEEAPSRAHRAPLIGEHNKEVYEELGIPKEEVIMLKQACVI